MPPKTVRALGTAVLGPLRWGQRTGFVRSALIGKAVDAKGKPRPWYSIAAIDFLDTLDFTNDSVLEFGSGQSTLWWAERAERVASVEESAEWYAYVVDSVAGAANVEVHLETDLERHARLPLRWERSFDVVVIDGGDRAACAKATLDLVRPDGLVIFDNSEGNWGPAGTFPIIDLFEDQGWSRIDFYGYAPGVLSTSVTSFFFKDSRRFRGLPPPHRGGK